LRNRQPELRRDLLNQVIQKLGTHVREMQQQLHATSRRWSSSRGTAEII